MRRDTLELADDSLFIERIKRTFTAADADPVIRAHAFLSKKACADDSTAQKAAVLLMEQDANATTVATALLTPILWKEYIDPFEIRDHFGSTAATALEEHSSPFIPTDHRKLRRRDIHAISSSIGGIPCKALLFITFRLLAMEKAVGSSGMFARKMAQDAHNLMVPIGVTKAGSLSSPMTTTKPAGCKGSCASTQQRTAPTRLPGCCTGQCSMVTWWFSEAAATLDLTLKDCDSIEVLADRVSPIGGTRTCANMVNGFDAAGSRHLI
jgi:hypothetical protein